MNYKGYVGVLEIDEDENVLFGRVVNIAQDTITFSGATVAQAREDFEAAIDDYLEWAEEEGFAPEKPFSGRCLVRMTPELHRDVSTAAAAQGQSMNQFIVDTLQAALEAALPGRKRSVTDRQSSAASDVREELSKIVSLLASYHAEVLGVNQLAITPQELVLKSLAYLWPRYAGTAQTYVYSDSLEHPENDLSSESTMPDPLTTRKLLQEVEQ